MEARPVRSLVVAAAAAVGGEDGGEEGKHEVRTPVLVLAVRREGEIAWRRRRFCRRLSPVRRRKGWEVAAAILEGPC